MIGKVVRVYVSKVLAIFVTDKEARQGSIFQREGAALVPVLVLIMDIDNKEQQVNQN